jgi:signal transduction histidine kinase
MLVGQVEDEGPGFNLESVTASYGTRASLGLLNMQERAAMVGGQLKIDTAPGHGTIVSVALPVHTD